ncbi:hypothetical protein [Virgibacillus phasianinus]|uniref:hypothetical protein n=1 Tax=Virgibacillus phasianinus TaxID=2017483 RepID=UPI0012FDFF76|nr:hypothetical protein [Virgibacillus phasianinus]
MKAMEVSMVNVEIGENNLLNDKGNIVHLEIQLVKRNLLRIRSKQSIIESLGFT